MTDMKLYTPGSGVAANANPGTTWQDIVHAINYRRIFAGELINNMVQVRDIYNGDWVLPLPDLVGEPLSKPAIPPLVSLAIDSPSDRAASVMPQIFCPALTRRPHGKGSANWADIRRRALHSVWYESGLEEQVLPKAFRHYRAYGSLCLQVRPDLVNRRARIETRDPLNTYPDLRSNELTSAPENVGFMTFRSRAWLKQNFGQSHPEVQRALWNSNRDDSDVFELVEWIDQDWYVLGVIGPRYYTIQSTTYPQWPIGGFELRRWPNRAGMVPVALPYRPTLDRVMGSVNHLIPIINKMAKLDLLEYFSAEKAVFPDLVVGGKDGEPTLVSGAWKDGRTGEANVIAGGDAKFLNTQPGTATQQRIDQLERSGRQASGNPAMFGGEATGNIRSGQTVSQLGSYSVDPDLQSMQRVMARALQVANDAVMAVERGWFGNRKIVAISGFATDDFQVTYTPNDHFEAESRSVVRYAVPGMDAESVTVAAAQLSGSGLASKATARRINPLIEDADAEEARIRVERLEDALLAGIVTQAQQPATEGGSQLVDLAHMASKLRAGATIEEAVMSADTAARARQAAMAPPAGPDQATSPEAQPGLSPPGVGAESQQPPVNPLVSGMPGDIGGQVPGQSPDMENLKQIFRSLRAH